MFWDNLDKVKDCDFFQEIEDRVNLKLIKYFLRYIFEGDRSYYELLSIIFHNREEREKKDILINYLTLIIVANTRYYNLYIKKYGERYFKEILNKLPNKIPIWEFIKISAHSRNNDLKLERLEVDKGLVNIYPVKRTYCIELIRVKLREMVEKIRENSDIDLLENKNVKEIVNPSREWLNSKV